MNELRRRISDDIVIVSINQPAYIPWLGYFDRIFRSDVHIILDTVQIERGGFTNRNRIMTRTGEPLWLTVPISYHYPISKTPIVAELGWQRKHRLTLAQNYGYDAWWTEKDWELLLPLLLQTTIRLAAELRQSWARKTRIVLASELGAPGKKSALILNLCKAVGATEYLSGPNGRKYLKVGDFTREGIGVVYHDFPAPAPVLSCLDYLYNPRSKKMWPQARLTSARSSPD